MPPSIESGQMPIPDLLRDLLATPGPSGQEAAPARVWREAAAAFAEVSTDALGSSLARVAGTGGGPLLALVAHIDEIGLVVTHVSDEGYLFFRPLGGWNPQVLLGQRVTLLGRDGPVPALVGRKWIPAPKPGEERKRVELDDLHLDLGARSREEALECVRLGDVAVVTAEPVELPNERIAARAVDDRVGAYVVLEAARRIAEAGGAPGDVVAAAVVGEEDGDYSGSRTAVFGLEPAVAVVVDVTESTDVPAGDPKVKGELRVGGGPAIGRGLPIDRRVSDLLLEAAAAEGIPHTVEVSSGTTSTDADAVHLSRAGVATGLISVPIRYLHTPNELVSLDDVEAAVRLLVAFARRLERLG